MGACRTFLAILFVALTSMSTSAYACMTQAPIELADVKYADVVVVGRISNYMIVGEPTLITAYARFDVLVDEVLVGAAPESLTVTWDNSTYGEPEDMPSGPFLIALRDPESGPLPVRGPSATVLPNPDLSLLTVLQAPCADPFIFASSSSETQAVLKILHR
jgi:hypothetical protein